MSEHDAVPAADVPTGVRTTALDPDFRADPHPNLDALRAADPVHHDQVLHRYYLTRHDDVDAVLRDRAHSVDPRNAAQGTFEQLFLNPEDREGQPSMLFSDPPYHTRLRGLVSKAFTPRAIESMAPEIERIANELLDDVAGADEWDLIAAYAAPLPTVVIAEMLGVDPAHREQFKRWSDDVVQFFNPMISADDRARAETSGEAMREYFRHEIAERRARPAGDLVSGLANAEEAGDRLSDDEIVTMCNLLLTAGNVTTTDLIGNGVLALLQHPDQFALLRDEPERIKNAVEEMLRYNGPVTDSGRTPMQDIEIGGVPIAARQSVGTSLAAANHDPAVYPDPHRFDITREDTHHHAFGGGVHFCLGAPLARLESQIAINTLLRRFPTLALAGGPLEWKTVPAFRGLARLQVRPR